MNVFSIHSLILFLSIVFTIPFSKVQHNPMKFQIKFFEAKNGVTIKCDEGCSWSGLSIKSTSFHLNQFGMVNVEKDTEAFNNSQFIILVEKDGQKLKLVGIKGTHWQNLSFDLPSNEHLAITINEQGINTEK